MKTYIYFIAILLSLFSFSFHPFQQNELKISNLFSDHMVLQQKQEVNLWGKYTPGQELTISSSWGIETSTTSDTNGNWKSKLTTPEAGGPYSIQIVAKDTIITMEDVMIGEVWLASGQSNMEMPLKGWPPNDTIKNSSQEIIEANYSDIRMFTAVRNLSRNPMKSITGEWNSVSSETAGDMSATAYFFAKRLHQELNVPIGIIHSSWGGTAAEAWTSNEKLRKLGDFNEMIDDLENPEMQHTIENWFQHRDTQEIPITDEQWQNINFSDLAATEQLFDDSQWDTIELPGRYDQFNSVEFDGAIWLRKKFTIQDVTSDYVLKIAAIDDMDATYVNGKKIGGLAGKGFWNVAREMVIPKSLLKKGSNTIAIRAIDTGGPGEINGPMTLSNNNGDSISIDGNWKFQLVSEVVNGKFYIYDLHTDMSKRPDMLQLHPNLPTVLFNAMINPLVNYTINGAIWYQGEANVGRDEQYKRLFPAMIEDWREQWGYNFPFYFVQIAPFIYNPNPDEQVSQKLRDAQRYSLKTPKTGMVVTLDIGNSKNIHPANKQDVGERLARLALANDYDKDIVPCGPLYKQLEKSGNKMTIKFDYVGSGLVSSDSGLTGFEIAGADKVYVPAIAKIKGTTVEVWHSSVATPLYVRYAWRDDSIASLFNLEGLPASSFTSDEM